MGMNNREGEVAAKFDRADTHLQEVKTIIRRYMDDNFGALSGDVEIGPQGGFHIRGTWPPPPWQLPVIIGDCVHGMRSGLEHLATYLVEANDGRATLRTGFPVMKCQKTGNTGEASRLPVVVGGIHLEALAILDSLQPYMLESYYAQHPLWVLHALWNQDKHRSLVIDANSPLSVSDSYTAGDPAFSNKVFPGRWQRIRRSADGATFNFIPDDPVVEVNAEFSFNVRFKEGSAGEGKPVCETLSALLEYVRDVLAKLAPFL